jgi:hypothetical protein
MKITLLCFVLLACLPFCIGYDVNDTVFTDSGEVVMDDDTSRHEHMYMYAEAIFNSNADKCMECHVNDNRCYDFTNRN